MPAAQKQWTLTNFSLLLYNLGFSSKMLNLNNQSGVETTEADTDSIIRGLSLCVDTSLFLTQGFGGLYLKG